MANPERDQFLTIRELSSYIKFSVQTIYGWVHQRRIPHVKKGNRLRFSLREVNRWLDEDSISVSPEPTATRPKTLG